MLHRKLGESNEGIMVLKKKIKKAIRNAKLRFVDFDKLNEMSKPKFHNSITDMFTKTGYCFVHIPKNGGTSVESILYEDKRVGHRTWKEWSELDPSNFREWKKFCIIRDPIDRLLSAFDYLSSGGRNLIDAEVARRYVRSCDSVNDFIESMREEVVLGNLLKYFHFQPQSEYILSDDNRCMVDRLLSFTNYNDDLADFLNIDSTQVEHKNKTIGKRTKREEISQHNLDFLSRIYQKDIKIFTYSQTKSDDVFGDLIM